MKIIACEQRSPEWWAARLGIATASNFAAILATIKSGESAERKNYRAKLVVERLTGKPADNGFTTQAMLAGVEREPIARAAYESTGAWVDEVGFIRHDTIEVGASPDGMLGDDGCLEIKCPTLATHLEYLRLPEGTCPTKYVAQVQGQMWLAERAWCDFVSFNPDFPENMQLVIRRVKKDGKYIATLSDAVEQFMREVREEEAAVNQMFQPEKEAA